MTELLDFFFTYSLNSDKLDAISSLLAKYFNRDHEKELQALVFLQELMEKLEHPPCNQLI
jgi:hypothetical protein